jgi:hypothetical protein
MTIDGQRIIIKGSHSHRGGGARVFSALARLPCVTHWVPCWS